MSEKHLAEIELQNNLESYIQAGVLPARLKNDRVNGLVWLCGVAHCRSVFALADVVTGTLYQKHDFTLVGYRQASNGTYVRNKRKPRKNDIGSVGVRSSMLPIRVACPSCGQVSIIKGIPVSTG